MKKRSYGMVKFKRNGSAKRYNPNRLYPRPYGNVSLKNYSDSVIEFCNKKLVKNDFGSRCDYGFSDESMIVSHVFKKKRKDIKLSNW